MHDKGLTKLIEECSELIVELAKFAAFPEGKHPDGKGDLRERINNEIADVFAAIHYFREQHEMDLDSERINRKLALFKQWEIDSYELVETTNFVESLPDAILDPSPDGDSRYKRQLPPQQDRSGRTNHSPSAKDTDRTERNTDLSWQQELTQHHSGRHDSVSPLNSVDSILEYAVNGNVPPIERERTTVTNKNVPQPLGTHTEILQEIREAIHQSKATDPLEIRVTSPLYHYLSLSPRVDKTKFRHQFMGYDLIVSTDPATERLGWSVVSSMAHKQTLDLRTKGLIQLERIIDDAQDNGNPINMSIDVGPSVFFQLMNNTNTQVANVDNTVICYRGAFIYMNESLDDTVKVRD